MNKITFTNKCSVPLWMPEYKKKFREDADIYFKNALEQVPFLKGCDIDVTYFLQGVGSIVAKIVSNSGSKYVMKTTETINHTNGEICSYKATTDAGIKVPKLFFNGIQDELPFLLIEYFEEGTFLDKLGSGEISLDDVAEIKANFFCSLKKIEGKGYCWPVKYEDGVLEGNFKDIEEFMDKWFCKEDFIEIAIKHFPYILWEKDLQYHVNKVKDQNANSNCRLGTFDFQTGHVFASNPPTLFDACFKLEPEYFDLAQLIIPFPDGNKNDVFLNKVVFSKYQENFGSIDIDKLISAVWLQAYRKATNQLKHSDEKRMKNGLHALRIISNEESLKKHIEEYLSL